MEITDCIVIQKIPYTDNPNINSNQQQITKIYPKPSRYSSPPQSIDITKPNPPKKMSKTY
jgi:hypothetical protein